MHVDIDCVGGNRELEEYDRLPAREQHAAVGLLHRMQDRSIAKRPSGHEEVLEPCAGHVVLWPPHESRYRDVAVGSLDLEQPAAERLAVQVGDPPPPGVGGGQVVDAAAAGGGCVVCEREGHARMGKCRPHERLG